MELSLTIKILGQVFRGVSFIDTDFSNHPTISSFNEIYCLLIHLGHLTGWWVFAIDKFFYKEFDSSLKQAHNYTFLRECAGASCPICRDPLNGCIDGACTVVPNSLGCESTYTEAAL